MTGLNKRHTPETDASKPTTTGYATIFRIDLEEHYLVMVKRKTEVI